VYCGADRSEPLLRGGHRVVHINPDAERRLAGRQCRAEIGIEESLIFEVAQVLDHVEEVAPQQLGPLLGIVRDGSNGLDYGAQLQVVGHHFPQLGHFDIVLRLLRG
jgi:hypothetical protein